MTGGTPWPLVGRAEELELLDGTVTAASGSFVVAGSAGVGKSRLAAELLARARDAGLETVVVRATRSMATIPFGAFARWTPDLSDATASRQAADRLQVLRAASKAIVGDHDRVVVSVDDAHLLDEGSAALVLHLVTDPRVSIVATVRSGEPCPDAVAALWKESLAERVDLQPLAEPESAALLADVLGGPLDQSARRRVWTLTQGIPLYMREVVRAADAQGLLVEDGGRWHWRGALAGSDRLHELIGDHLARLDADERQLVELLAFGEPLAWAMIDALGLRSELAAAERHGVITLDDDDPDGGQGTRVRLCHPLYGEVLRTEVPPVRAREHRSALVRAALAVGLQAREPLVVAEWALNSDEALAPDDALAAARQALALSEWALAEKLTEAVAPDGEDARAVLVRAVALSPQLRWNETMAMLAGLAVGSLDDETCLEVAGEAARIHAWMLFWRPLPKATLAEVRAATDRLPAPLRPLATAHCAFQSLLVGRPADAVLLADEVLDASAGDDLAALDAVQVQALSVKAFALGLQGRARESLEAAETGLPLVAAILADDPVPGNPAGAMPVAFCTALVLSGRIEEAAAVAGFIHDGQGQAPALQSLAAALAARMELYAGRVGSSHRLAHESFSTCRETGQLPASHWPAATLASAAAQAGDPEPGDEALHWALDACPIGPLYGFEARLAEAWLDAARGQVSAARAAAIDTAEAAASAGLHAFAIFSLLDLARFGAAREAAERLAALPPTVEGAYVSAVTDYVGALADGDAAALATASAQFEEMGALLLAAEAAANEAVAHGKGGRQSSEASARGRARVLAARCEGAATPAVRDLAGDEVLALLTDREREVVELAARGLSNREIGERLYVSVRTVNTHLYRSYAKLGVNDRAQLAPLLLAPEDGAPTET